jgi:predicted AAA+ superfamily ATPase
VPDDSSLRLIFLAPEQFYAREETRPAFDAVLDYVRNNGTKPRYRGSRLVSLSPDPGSLARLRDCIRVALAWGSIVDDVSAGRLNIDQLQKKQAEKELQTSEDVLPRVARACARDPLQLPPLVLTILLSDYHSARINDNSISLNPQYV